MVIPTSKTCYFEASEDVITKFKSQGLHIIRIKYVRNHVKLLHVYKSRRGFSKGTVLYGGY